MNFQHLMNIVPQDGKDLLSTLYRPRWEEATAQAQAMLYNREQKLSPRGSVLCWMILARAEATRFPHRSWLYATKSEEDARGLLAQQTKIWEADESNEEEKHLMIECKILAFEAKRLVNEMNELRMQIALNGAA